MNKILSAPIEVFNLPEEVLNTYQKKNYEFISHTISRYGQQMPISATEIDGKLYIVKGITRYYVCKELKIPMLKYILVDVPDGNIIQLRMLLNQRTKTSIIQSCFEAEYILNVLGKSQGKKRSIMGFDNMSSEEEFGQVGKDRYELACALVGLKMKASSLRKLMEVFWSEYPLPEKEQIGALKQLNDGKISIDQAYKLINKNNEKLKKKADRDQLKLQSKNGNEWFKLYNKSSIIMDEVENGSIDLIIDSHPYWKQRKYRNQGENPHGIEKTPEEFVKTFVQGFCREKWKKLKLGGVMVTILGETYQNGYQGICTKVETALADDGWSIIDVNIWVKKNAKFTPHNSRFLNSYERIIVACKPGAEPYFQEVMRPSSTKRTKIIKTKSGGCSLATPESCITNVFTTAVHNSKELKVVRDDFQHDAPAREDIYSPFIEAYSKPGDTVLDGFVGSGTVGIALTMGRNVIGYDIDNVSIEFCEERFKHFLNDQNNANDNLAMAA